MDPRLKNEIKDAIEAIEADPPPPAAQPEPEPPADEMVDLQADSDEPMFGPNKADKQLAADASEEADELDALTRPNAPPLHPYRCRRCGKDVEQHTAWAPCPYCGHAFHG